MVVGSSPSLLCLSCSTHVCFSLDVNVVFATVACLCVVRLVCNMGSIVNKFGSIYVARGHSAGFIPRYGFYVRQELSCSCDPLMSFANELQLVGHK